MPTSTRLHRPTPEIALLDVEQVAAFLAVTAEVRWPGGQPPREVHVERVWPVGDDALAVEWSFLLADGTRYSLHATPVEARDAHLGSSREPVVRAGVLQGFRIELAGQGVAVHSMDLDGVMTQLPDCLDAVAMSDCLAPYRPHERQGVDGPQALRVRPLAYRARRRATLRYRWGEQGLIGKVFRDDRGESAAQRHFLLRDRLFHETGGRVTVPGPIGYLPELRMLLLSWCQEPHERPAGRSLTDDLSATMNALASLHWTSIEGLPAFSCNDETAIVERWASALVSANGNGECALGRLIPVWRIQRPPRQRCVTVHRDFYGRQVLLGDNHATLIDLDTLSHGDPAVDVGNFLAHRWLEAVQYAGDQAANCFEHQAREALVAYQAGGGKLKRGNLRWFWASALLRLGAVHALRTTTGRFAEALWTSAADLLGATSVLPAHESRRSAAFDADSILTEVRE